MSRPSPIGAQPAKSRRCPLGHRAALTLAALALVVSAAGCSATPARIGRAITLHGYARADHPIVNAKVTAIDASGKPIAATVATTAADGAFELRVPSAPERFSVVITGGTRDGHALQGRLKSDVESRNATETMLVSPLTSLASAWGAKHPNASVADAHAKVKAALDIPASVNTTSWMAATAPHFDDASYLTAAKREGNIDRLETKLVKNMDASTGTVRFRSRLGVSEGADEDGGAWVDGVEAAAQMASGPLMGWVLTKAGIPTEASKLSDMSSKLDAIQSNISALRDEIASLKIQMLSAEIEDRDDTVQSGVMQLAECATTTPDPDTAQAAETNASALRNTAESQPFNHVLSDNSTTHKSDGGLFRVCRAALALQPYWLTADVDGIRGQFGYYEWKQADEYTLIADYLHKIDPSAPSTSTASTATANTITTLGKLYAKSIASQKSNFPPPTVPLHTAIAFSTRNKLMIAYGMVARWDDPKWSASKDGIARKSSHDPGWAVRRFNSLNAGGYNDWRLPTRAEADAIFSNSDFGNAKLYASPSSQASHLPRNGIIWTSDWEKGWAYSLSTNKSFASYYVPDPADQTQDEYAYNGTNERYSPGPASVVFVRSVSPAEGYWTSRK